MRRRSYCQIRTFLLLFTSILVQFLGFSAADEVTLLDTDATQWVNWTSSSGWRQQSLPNTAKRVYGVCRLKDLENDHWLRSPYIPKGEGVSLHVELHFTMRECRNYPNPTELRHCGDTLGLYYRDSDPMGKPVGSFRKETVIAPDRKWLDSSDKGNHMNVRTVRIRPTGPGMFMALRDTGSCVAVYRVRVYFKVCPDRLVNFTRFPATPAGHLYDVIDVPGRCVSGAQMQDDKTSMSFCKADGSWHDANRAWCMCRVGHEALGRSSCIQCRPGTYKPTIGPGSCISCPRNSFASSGGASVCACDSGHLRHPGLDSSASGCTRPPSPPQGLRIVRRSDVAVVLAWRPPADLGGRTDLRYFVTCSHCSVSVEFAPSGRFLGSNVTISRLAPNTAYRFTVHAVNGVSDLLPSTDSSSVSVDLHTEPRMSNKIERLQLTRVTAHIVFVSWQSPPMLTGGPHKYQLRFCSHSDNCNLYYADTESYRVTNLSPDSEYTLQVRVETPTGAHGEFSDLLTVRTLKSDDVSVASAGSWSVEQVVYVVIPLIGVTVFFIVIAACIVNRRKSDASSGRESVTPYSNIIFSPSVEANKFYVDPHTYEDLTDAIREFTQEIDASWVSIDHVIGGGEFGDVCKGVLAMPGRYAEVVAVKTLKTGANEKSRADFLLEASIMGQFQHAHVIRLLGVVTKAQPVMIVTEFMQNGSLDRYLKTHSVSARLRLTMLRGVASGMSYLANMGFVHRDLAARNILVDRECSCKVSDFGLSRVLESDTSDGAYVTRGGKIPVRWTAPEAINFRKYTSSSDVWSFGIVVWEVFSGGERPYWEWTNHEVIQSVNGGFRLPRPERCPDCVYRLTMDCWNVDRLSRPTFPELVNRLDELIAMEIRRRPPPKPPTPTSLPLLCPYTEVDVWLQVIGMERYAKLLRSHGFLYLNHAFQLTSSVLSEMGVQSMSDRQTLLGSIEAARVFVLDKMNASEGCFV